MPFGGHYLFLVRVQIRSGTAELEAAVKRIEHDQELIAMLWQERAELQAKAYWVEKNNLSVRGLTA